MHNPGIARLEFHRFDVLGLRCRNRNDEVPIYVPTLRRERVRLAHRNDQIRRSKLPAFGPLWQRRQVRSGAFFGAFRDPLRDEAGLLAGQTAVPDKLTTIAVLGQPRWHVPPCGDVGDFGGVLLDVGIIEQIEWSRLPRAVATGTLAEYDGRNFFVEGQRARLPWNIDPRAVAL